MIKELLNHSLGPIWKFSCGLPKAPVWDFWHGLGEKGSDINRVLATGLPEVLNQGFNIPFNVYADQDANGWWREDTETPVTIDFIKSQPDSGPIFGTGLSSGGNAGGRWLRSGRDDLKGIVIIAANMNEFVKDIPNMTLGIPVWIFMGETDNTVNPPESAEAFVKAYNAKFPGKIKRTVFKGVGHSEALWNNIYRSVLSSPVLTGDPVLYAPFDQSIYDWALDIIKEQPAPPDEIIPLEKMELVNGEIIAKFGDRKFKIPGVEVP